MADQTETEALLSAMASPTHLTIGGIDVIVKPADFSVDTLERLQEIERPRRIVRKAVANDVRGFVDYTIRYKGAASCIYADSVKSPKLLARIDDHSTEPSHVTHTVEFGCPLTHEWTTWNGKNKSPMNQVQFAEFIEANSRDVIAPDGASLLTAVLNFQDHGSAKFHSAVRLANGRVQFTYSEKDENDKLEFPEMLELALPVFEGSGKAYKITAKLRYRIKRDDDAGMLTLWYELDRPDLAVRQAYDDLIADVEAKTGIHIVRAL